MNSALLMKEKHRLVKFLVCFIGGLILTKLIGYPNVITISITALLVINADRGERGSVVYMKRRIGTNVICAILSVVLMTLFTAFVPLPMWIQVIVVSTIVLLIGIYLDAKYLIAPQALTIACADLIIISGMLAAPLYPIRRVVLVSIGCVMGYVVDYFILPRSPLAVARAGLTETATALAWKVRRFAEAAHELELDAAHLAHMDGRIAAEQADINLLKANIENRKYRDHKDEILKMDAVNQVQRKNVALLRLFQQKREVLDGQPEAFQTAFFSALEQLCAVNTAVVGNLFAGEANEVEPLGEIAVPVENNEQVVLVGHLLEYRETLKLLQL